MTTKEAYVEWVTGLDTEPPLEGAFNAGWHTRDAEVERLMAVIDAAKSLRYADWEQRHQPELWRVLDAALEALARSERVLA